MAYLAVSGHLWQRAVAGPRCSSGNVSGTKIAACRAKAPMRVASTSGRHAPNGQQSTSVELPGGVLWWLPTSEFPADMVYGQNFVLQRPRRGAQGIVKSSRPTTLQPLLQHQQSVEVVSASAAEQPGDAALYPFDPLDITAYAVVTDAEEGAMFPADAMRQAQQCLGIVLHAAAGRAAPQEDDGSTVESDSDSPRRTKKLKFTCNMCGTTTIRPVNPFAYSHGSVFARCGGCNVMHKVTDHLKLFHELKGPIFPAGSGYVRKQVKIPRGLPQSPPGDLEVGLGGKQARE